VKCAYKSDLFGVQVKVYNMDGEEFIKSVIKPDLLQQWNSASEPADIRFHVVMNLPSLAVEFLKSFRGLLSDCEVLSEPRGSLMPVIYCYVFSNADDPVTDAAWQTAAALGITSLEQLPDHDVRTVRSVAPGKDMLCVNVRLPWHVLHSAEHGMTA